MRKNEFESPQRQSQYAIIFIVLRFLRNILRQTWPIFLAFFLGRGNSTFNFIEMGIAGLGVFGMVISIISYYRYFYHLTDTELVISHGILQHVKQNIPFERIQSVNFKQSFVHQFFKVTEVEIETAGSEEQETKIDALEIPLAELLRARILQSKLEIGEGDKDDSEDALIVEERKENILHLAPKDLIRVGLAQNHFRPIGLLLGLLATIAGYSYSFDYEDQFFIKTFFSTIEDFSENLVNFQENVPWVNITIFVVALLILSVLYSIASTFLRHYNLQFWRIGPKFQLVRGLLTKNEFAALDNKIQILNWGQNPFERSLGFYNIQFRQARSGGEGRRQGAFGIPGCQVNHVDFVRESWLGKNAGLFDHYKPISIHFFIRKALYTTIFFVVIGILIILVKDATTLVPLLLVYSLMIWVYWISYKKKTYALNHNELYVGGGIIGFRHALLPYYKVQNLSITQNPYQWRRDLATLVVSTAGGRVQIPYISYNEAQELLDVLTYRVEQSKKPWM